MNMGAYTSGRLDNAVAPPPDRLAQQQLSQPAQHRQPQEAELVACIPIHPSLDEEADAATAIGLPVIRFRFLDHLEIVSGPSSSDIKYDDQRQQTGDLRLDGAKTFRGLHRGFMLSEERYHQLFEEFERLHVRLLTTPDQYARAHYYPNAYPFVKDFSPRSCWCAVPYSDLDQCSGNNDDHDANGTTTGSPSAKPKPLYGPELFQSAVKEVESWPGVTHVMLKDYVKSAKPHFLKEPVAPRKVWINHGTTRRRGPQTTVASDGDDATSMPRSTKAKAAEEQEGESQPDYAPKIHTLADVACELVAERGIHFNRGVVFKEYKGMDNPRNEWRAWFVKGELLSVDFNSEDVLYSAAMPPEPVPQDLLEAAAAAAKKLGSPFMTIDFAQAADKSWFCIETGDGGVSGPAVNQFLPELWQGLRSAFE